MKRYFLNYHGFMWTILARDYIDAQRQAKHWNAILLEETNL